MAWLGLVWLGLDWPGLAWLGLVWLGLAWLGLAWLGLLGLAFLGLDSESFSIRHVSITEAIRIVVSADTNTCNSTVCQSAKIPLFSDCEDN
jgi:hypothetical protein